MKKTPNLDKLLERQLRKVRQVCNRLPNGKTQLADYLGIRLSEVSRYLTTSARNRRKPSGPIVLGMQQFVTRHGLYGNTGARSN